MLLFLLPKSQLCNRWELFFPILKQLFLLLLLLLSLQGTNSAHFQSSKRALFSTLSHSWISIHFLMTSSPLFHKCSHFPLPHLLRLLGKTAIFNFRSYMKMTYHIVPKYIPTLKGKIILVSLSIVLSTQ